MPISIPVIDMVEIGAGGGSLAQVDALSQIRVGPESAGSEPGPACYGRGGTAPSVTDADLLLGKLDPAAFAGGTIPLYPDRSAQALTRHIGDQLDMEASEAAWGVAEMVDENMANAARVHAVENGEDLSDYTMIAFGGAAPLHAARLCEKLGVARCLIPQGAGVGSAIGFLRAPFSFEANSSVFMRLSAFEPDKVKQLFAEMEDEAASFVRSCDETAEIRTEHKVYMRYAGQGWEIPVPLTPAQVSQPEAAVFTACFEREYEQLFARTVAGMEIEITVWSVNAFTDRPAPDALEQAAPQADITTEASRQLFDPSVSAFVTAAVASRENMRPGAPLAGPALITEDETTIIIPSSRQAVACCDGTIDMHVKQGAAQ